MPLALIDYKVLPKPANPQHQFIPWHRPRGHHIFVGPLPIPHIKTTDKVKNRSTLLCKYSERRLFTKIYFLILSVNIANSIVKIEGIDEVQSFLYLR